MAFPDNSFSSSAAIGLDRSGENIADFGLGSGDAQTSGTGFSTELLPDTDTDTSNEDIVNSVLGVSQSESWTEETRKVDLSEPLNALNLMRAYVNVINNSNASPLAGNGEPASQGGGRGFLMSLAAGIDDPNTLNLVTQFLQPNVEDNLISFSVLGFGQFMVVGEPDSGNLTIMDLANGRNLALSNSDPYADGGLSAEESIQDSGTFMPNEGDALAQILFTLAAIVTNPMFIFPAGCIFCVWVVYRLAKRVG